MNQQCEKFKPWTTKNYVNNIVIYFINILLLGGIFLLLLSLNNLSNETAGGIKEFFSEPKRPLFYSLVLVIFGSITFIFYFVLDKENMRNVANAEMTFLIIEIAVVINFIIGSFINVYLRPMALVALLTTFLGSKRVAFFNGAIFCIHIFLLDLFMGKVMTAEDYIFFIVSISASIVAVVCIGDTFSRFKILIRSLFISIYPMIGVVISYFSEESNQVSILFTNLVNAFCSGPLAVGIFLIILPFFEAIFGKLTRFKLAEMTDHKSKLIQRLILEAPGTFNHSVLVSNIAESCATAIGEDALLARTCAYYHDIGKLRRPEYFTENNVGGDNPHNGLTPELSTNIIKSHTTDGYNLLIKHNFPKEIANICIEHHGTMPIYFFYHKAKQFTDGEVNIANYCYTESKPQTKIAAIIMLADSCEAASRTLTDRSRENVKKTVDKIAQDRMDMGQFDECDITLKEISIIKNTIVNNITGIYHNRIEYPKVVINDEQKEEVKEIKETQKDKANG